MASYRNMRKPSTALIDAVKEAKNQKTRKGMKLLNDVISSGPDLNEPDEDGFTALVYAVRLDLPSAVQLLVDSGATVDLIDEDGNTPFFYACTFQNWDVARILVEAGANPDHVGEGGMTPLLMAIDMQDVSRVETILQLGASPNAVNKDGVPPVMVALCHKRLPCQMDVFMCLLEYGAELHVTDREGTTPLMSACSSSHPSGEVLELLFNKGVDLNAKNAYGKTALHCAVVVMNLHTIEMLLDAGASPDVTQHDGLTPLYLAYPPNGKSGAQLLLCHGADVNKVTYFICPYLLMQIFLTRFGLDMVRDLLAAGIEPLKELSIFEDCRSSQLDLKTSPLLCTMAEGQYHVSHLLLEGLFYTQEEVQFLQRLRAEIPQLIEAASKTPFLPGSRGVLDGFPFLNFLSAGSEDRPMGTAESGSNRREAEESWNNGSSNEEHHDTATGDHENMPETGVNSGSSNSHHLSNNNSNSDSSSSSDMMMNSLLTKDDKARLQICALVSLVPSLKQFSRRTIHRALGVRKNRTQAVCELPIAPSLHRYLLFKIN